MSFVVTSRLHNWCSPDVVEGRQWKYYFWCSPDVTLVEKSVMGLLKAQNVVSGLFESEHKSKIFLALELACSSEGPFRCLAPSVADYNLLHCANTRCGKTAVRTAELSQERCHWIQCKGDITVCLPAIFSRAPIRLLSWTRRVLSPGSSTTVTSLNHSNKTCDACTAWNVSAWIFWS
jgi:hypothetical protein